MKKFLSLAVAGLLLGSGNVFAFIGEDPARPGEQCVSCNELSTDELDFDVCSYVAVPLSVSAVETDIILDCVYRPGYYKNPEPFNGNNGKLATRRHNTLDPSGNTSGGNAGQLGFVTVGGDENDDIDITFSGLSGGYLQMQHVAHDGQNSDDWQDNPTSFWFEVWMYVDYAPHSPPSYLANGGQTIRMNKLVKMPQEPSNTVRVRLGNGNVGPSVNTGSGYVGLKFGGYADIRPGQQRGTYEGAFDLAIAYVP